MKINLDRASNPDSHLKRYNLFKMIDKTEAVDADTVKIVLKAPFSAFVNNRRTRRRRSSRRRR